MLTNCHNWEFVLIIIDNNNSTTMFTVLCS